MNDREKGIPLFLKMMTKASAFSSSMTTLHANRT